MGKYDALLQEPAPAKGGKYAALLEQAPTPTPEAEGPSLTPEFVLDRTPIVGEIREIGGQLSGTRPSSALRAGLSAASLASYPLSATLRAASGIGSAGLQGVKEALAAGAGAATAGGAAELGEAPVPVQIAAALLGGIAGGRAAMPKAALPTTAAAPAAEIAAESAVPYVPQNIPPATKSPLVAGAVPKATEKQAAALSQEWLGGKPLTLGQKQELAAPGVGTMAKQVEFKMTTADKAASALSDIADKSRAIAAKLREFSGVGPQMTTGKAGSQIASRYEKLLEEAGQNIGAAEDAVKALPGFKQIRQGFREPVLAELNSIAKEYKLTGKLVSSVPKEERAFFKEVVQEAKKIGNIDDVITFRRWLRNEIKDSQRALKLGTGDFIDALEQRIYSSVEGAIESMPLKPAEAEAVQNFLAASKNYAITKFSNEAKAVRDVLGFKGFGIAPDKSPEQIVEVIFKGQRGLAGKLDQAAKAGLIDKAEVSAAAWAKVFGEAVDPQTGILNRAALRKIVSDLDDSQGIFLFGKNFNKLKQAASVADLVTYAQRMYPQTGFGAKALEWAGAVGSVPVVGDVSKTLAQKAYYAAPAVQNVLAPGVVDPRSLMRTIGASSRAALPGRPAVPATFFQALSQAQRQ